MATRSMFHVPDIDNNRYTMCRFNYINMTICFSTAMAIQAIHHKIPIDDRILTRGFALAPLPVFSGSGAKGVTCIKEAWRQQQQLEGLGLVRFGSC